MKVPVAKNMFVLSVLFCLGFSTNCFAVPDVADPRITDVTTSAFSLVWMTDANADPGIEVYADTAMSQTVADLTVTIMPTAGAAAAEAARKKGIMKVSVSGLSAGTKYYARAVTRDPLSPQAVASSPLLEVVTAARTVPYLGSGGAARAVSNDLLLFSVYFRPSDTWAGLGDLILLESDGAGYPLSAFAGDGASTPEGLIDLNNAFGTNGLSLGLEGAERLLISVYRGTDLPVLVHYRKVPANSGTVSAQASEKGFFADINLDGNIDETDFSLFKAQYRSIPEDPHYNPDFDFVPDPGSVVDAREFSKFSKEYGRKNVQ